MIHDLTGKIRRFFNVNDNTDEIKWSRSKIYKMRIEQLKYGWIAAGILILIAATLPAAVSILLFTIFTSLAFLDRD